MNNRWGEQYRGHVCKQKDCALAVLRLLGRFLHPETLVPAIMIMIQIRTIDKELFGLIDLGKNNKRQTTD